MNIPEFRSLEDSEDSEYKFPAVLTKQTQICLSFKTRGLLTLGEH